jgi:hypothetical protein
MSSKKRVSESKMSKQGLPQWAKGTIVNPGNTREKRIFSRTVQELLQSKQIDVTFTIDSGDGDSKKKRIKVDSDKALAYGLAAAMIIRGMKGDAAAIRELINRAEGRAPEVERIPEAPEKSGQVIKYGDQDVQF